MFCVESRAERIHCSYQMNPSRDNRNGLPALSDLEQRHSLSMSLGCNRLSPFLPPAEGVRPARRDATPGDRAEPSIFMLGMTIHRVAGHSPEHTHQRMGRNSSALTYCSGWIPEGNNWRNVIMRPAPDFLDP